MHEPNRRSEKSFYLREQFLTGEINALWLCRLINTEFLPFKEPNYKIRLISIVLGKNVILQSIQAYGKGFLYENNYNIYLIFISSFLQAILIAVYDTYLNINRKVCWFHVSNSCPQHNTRTTRSVHNITRVQTATDKQRQKLRQTDPYHWNL